MPPPSETKAASAQDGSSFSPATSEIEASEDRPQNQPANQQGVKPKGRFGMLYADNPDLRPKNCANCGTQLKGKHCHHCGQKGFVHRSLKEIGHDLMHGVLHLDGKLWRTLPLLTFKPGRLMRRYIDGERVKFVSPMAMFLFSVFLMFAVFQALGIGVPTDLEGEDLRAENIVPAEEVNSALAEGRSQIEADLEQARAELAGLDANNPARAEIEARIAERIEDSQGVDTAEAIIASAESGSVEFNGTGIAWIDQGLIEKWKKNPGLMLYKLQTNFYKFSWVLIPLSIPFVWAMFFWRRRFKAYDHAIFVTYSLGFMSLLFVTLSLLGAAGLPTQALVLAGVLIPPLHIYKQLKYGYDLSRRGALWRTAALTNGIVFGVLMIFLWLLLVLGAF